MRDEGLMPDNIHGSHSLHILLSIVFNSMLIHGVCPDSMIRHTIAHAPKNKNNSDNYRSIALSSIINKLV